MTDCGTFSISSSCLSSCASARTNKKPCKRSSDFVGINSLCSLRALREILFPRFRPVQMLVQEGEGADAMDRVRAVEEFDGRPLRDFQVGIELAHLGVFIRHPLVRSDA